jgi:glycosyltransferase involved in cell wall biosynthesis
MTADTVGGVWTYALELADALAEHGVEVVLAAMGGPLRPDQRRQLHRSQVLRAYAADFALEWMDEPWRDVDRAGDWLLRIADETEPHLVHLNSYAHAALPWGAPVVVVGHSDVLSWHAAVRGRPAGAAWARYRDAVAAGLEAADILVAPTQAMLDELIRLYEPPCPRTVIPNGSSRPLPLQSKDELVLTAGRAWDEAKNIQALERVAPRLDWQVAFARGGVARDVLDRLYARAAIFAEPARYEPFGLAALEAGRAGCALVLGDIASLREVWADAALYVPPGDDDALEHALVSLIRDVRSRTELAVRAGRRALTYSAERMARGYAELYDRTCARAEV